MIAYRALAVALCSAMLVAGCRAGGEPQNGASPEGVIGRITQLRANRVSVSGEPVQGPGHPLIRGSLITSTAGGAALFEVTERLQPCAFRGTVNVEVLPAARIVLRLAGGGVTCMTPASGKTELERLTIAAGAASDVAVGFVDPVFHVSSNASGVEIWVEHGFTEVSRRGSDRGRLVGPGSALSVQPQGALPEAVPFDPADLPAPRREMLQQMLDALPEPDYSVPSTGNSQILSTVLSSGTLSVGLDEAASTEVERFVSSLTGFLGEQWELDIETTRLAHADAPSALSSGDLELFFSTEVVEGADFLPLFGDESETSWLLWSRPDEDFQSALVDFVRTALDYGHYADRYLEVFGRVPTYEAVRSLVYPSTVEDLAQPRWRPAAQRSPGAAPTPSPSPTGTAGPQSTFAVSSVSLAVDNVSYTGTCPVTRSFIGRISSEGGAGDVVFQFSNESGERSSRARLSLREGETRSVTFTRSVGSSTSGSQTLEIIEPNRVLSNPAKFEVTCVGVPAGGPGGLEKVLDDTVETLQDLLDDLLTQLDA